MNKYIEVAKKRLDKDSAQEDYLMECFEEAVLDLEEKINEFSSRISSQKKVINSKKKTVRKAEKAYQDAKYALPYEITEVSKTKNQVKQAEKELEGATKTLTRLEEELAFWEGELDDISSTTGESEGPKETENVQNTAE